MRNPFRRNLQTPRTVLRANVRRNEEPDSLPLKILLGAVGIALVAALIWGILHSIRWSGKVLFTQNPEYQITHIPVTTDGILKSVQIVDFAEVKQGTNLYEVDLESVRARLEQIPLVAQARVRREIPSTLSIHLEERKPVARLTRDANGLHFIIDQEGRLLGVREQASHLPMLLGVHLPRAPRPGLILDEPRLKDGLRLLQLIQDRKLINFLPVGMISIAPSDYLDVRLRSGQVLWLPRKRLEDVVDQAAAILQRERESDSTNSFYNFTTGKNIIAQ